MVRKYVKKPMQVYALVWTGKNRSEVFEFVGDYAKFTMSAEDEHPQLILDTLEGPMRSSVGDYIIKGVKDEFYACKPDVFLMTYELTK